MNGLRRSLALTFLDRYAGLFIGIVSTMILARLLTPEELGIFSVASVFVLLASILRDFGVADYLVQVKEVTPEALGSAFLLMLLVSWSLAVLLWLGAGPVADFYQEPGVAEVLHVLALNFVLIPFGAVFMALLKRAMRFEISLRIHLAQNLTHAGVAVALAWAGFGYMSLAWASLAGVVVTVLGSLWYRPRDLKPRWTLQEAPAVARFGGWASLGTISSTAANSLPELAIGRALGMAPVSYFSRATGLVRLFDHFIMWAAAPVVMPHFSRLRREGGDLAGHALEMIRFTTALAWPFFALLALLAAPLIRLLYGDQWGPAVPVAQAMALFGAAMTAAPFGSMVLKALGRPQDDGWINLVYLLLVAVALALTLEAGLVWVALGVSLAMAVRSALYVWRLQVLLGFAWRAYLAILAQSATLAGLTLAVAGALWYGLDWQGSLWWQWAGMAVAGSAGLVAWGLALRWMRHPVHLELSKLRARLPGVRTKGEPSP